MNEVEITIVNWEKYQNRKDIKNPNWFRMENRVYSSESLYGLSSAEKWVWICLLSLANQKNTDTITCRKDWLLHETDIIEREYDSAIEKLIANGCVRTRTDPLHDKTDKQTDTTDRTPSNGTAVLGRSSPHALLQYPDAIITGEWIQDNFGEWEEVLKVYPDEEWIIKELAKMAVWLESNRHKLSKTRKGLRQRVMNWLHRGWDGHAKSLPSRPHKINHDALWEKK